MTEQVNAYGKTDHLTYFQNAHAYTIKLDTHSVSETRRQRGHKPAHMQHDMTEMEQINPDVLLL